MAVFAGARQRDNNAFGTVTDNPLTAGAVTLNSAGLANVSAVSGNHVVLVLDPLRSAGAPEIVIVTAHTGAATSATITRGAYGTVARSHAAGVLWVLAATADDLIRICTSGTRPADVYEGQFIYETDTDSYKGHNGTAWEHGLTLGAWTAYTPTLTQGGAVTKTVTYARYMKVGRQITVAVTLQATGAGTAATAVAVGLPVAAAVITGNPVVGAFYLADVSASPFNWTGTALLITTTTVQFIANQNAGYIGATSGGFTAALASGDVIEFTGTYEAAT